MHVLVDLRLDADCLNGRFGVGFISSTYPGPQAPYPAHLFCILSTSLSLLWSSTSTAMSSTAEAAAAAKAASLDAAQSATALFDIHLKLLGESYLAFFVERCATPRRSRVCTLNLLQ